MKDAGLFVDDARIVEYVRLSKVWFGFDPDALPTPGVVVACAEIGTSGSANSATLVSNLYSTSLALAMQRIPRTTRKGDRAMKTKPSQAKANVRRLRETTNARVWAEEYCEVLRHAGLAIRPCNGSRRETRLSRPRFGPERAHHHHSRDGCPWGRCSPSI